MAITFRVPSTFLDNVDAAVMRLGYLYPTWSFEFSGDVLSVTGVDDESLAKKEVNYALYRERIRTDGAPLRELLLRSVLL